jgi:FAD/FMN-containing dehydrogenase
LDKQPDRPPPTVSSSSRPDVAALGAIVGTDHVLTDRDVVAGYEVDWTGRFRGRAAAVVRPATVEEVAAVVMWCADHGVALVPQGGNTGLVGGGVPVGPARDAIVVSTARLTALAPVDTLAAQMTAGAGVTLHALHAHAHQAGLAFGVDLAARDSATVGGMVATNAGGVRVVRHGSMRAQVLGVEAVLGNGALIRHLDGLVKDNTGYDLAGLLVGSEGTLGVVTAARLRLVPDPPDRVVVLAGMPSMAEAMAVTAALRADVDGLDAIEAVVSDGVALVCQKFDLPSPLPPPTAAVLLLVEWAGRGEPPPALIDALDLYPTVAAADAPGRARLWRYREAMSEAVARVGVPHKLDVTLPSSAVAAFAAAVNDVVVRVVPGAHTYLFGHLGDGNLHVNVVGADPHDDSVDDAVLRLVAAHGGSISAEHGIGRAKASWLGLSRSSEEQAAFRAIKHALDPAGILNPGVLI